MYSFSKARRTRGVTTALAQAGMTLVEIMVVILLIGTLTTVLAVNILGSSEEAKVQTTGIRMTQIKGALTNFKQEYGRYPQSSEGLNVLINPPTKASGRQRAGGFLDDPESLTDAWGNPLSYVSPGEGGKEFDIKSYGADGTPGGEGKDADFTNWTVSGTATD